jgi:hypothetical protein
MISGVYHVGCLSVSWRKGVIVAGSRMDGEEMVGKANGVAGMNDVAIVALEPLRAPILCPGCVPDLSSIPLYQALVNLRLQNSFIACSMPISRGSAWTNGQCVPFRQDPTQWNMRHRFFPLWRGLSCAHWHWGRTKSMIFMGGGCPMRVETRVRNEVW